MFVLLLFCMRNVWSKSTVLVKVWQKRVGVFFQKMRTYALVRPFLNFDHFHIFDLFCTLTHRPYFDLNFTWHTPSVRPFLYFDHFHTFDIFCTSTTLLRYFVKSGLRLGREVQVEVQFWSK